MKKAVFLLGLLIPVFLSSCEKDEFSGTEAEKIDQYIASKNLIVTESTSTGLQYIRTKDGTGSSLKTTQFVTLKYTGKLLSEKVFDSGSFGFILGIGQVVRGFDEGVAKMKVGEQATIIFPSNLGYGSTKQGSIPKNSPLIFEIEILAAE